MNALETSLKEVYIFEENFETLDFMNVFEVEFTNAGLKRKIIDQLEAELKTNGPIIAKEDKFEIDSLTDINTPIFELKRSQLIELCTQIFEKLGLIEFLKVDRSNVKEFFKQIARRYKRVPYHHFTHGVWLMK